MTNFYKDPFSLLEEPPEERKIHAKKLLKDANPSKKLLIETYLRLAEKNTQSGNYRSYTRFIKIFPQFFSTYKQDFFNDPEIEGILKVFLGLNLKMNIFDQSVNTQPCFWFILFNNNYL